MGKSSCRWVTLEIQVFPFLIIFRSEYAPKGPFTKDVRLTPGEGGLRNPDVQLLFECDSIVLSGRRGEGGLEILVLAGRPL